VTRRSLLHAVLEAPAEPSAVIYLRVSTKARGQRGGEVEGFSIPAQRAACLQGREPRRQDDRRIRRCRRKCSLCRPAGTAATAP
jgi:hypothetical protein